MPRESFNFQEGNRFGMSWGLVLMSSYCLHSILLGLQPIKGPIVLGTVFNMVAVATRTYSVVKEG